MPQYAVSECAPVCEAPVCESTAVATVFGYLTTVLRERIEARRRVPHPEFTDTASPAQRRDLLARLLGAAP